MISAIAFVLAAGPSLTGPQAIERIKTILASFDERGPFRIQRLGNQEQPGSVRWDVRLTGRGGATYEGWIGGPNGEINLTSGGERDAFGANPKPYSPTPEDSRRVSRWLKRIGVREPTRLLDWTLDDTGVQHVYAAILRNGYLFVSRPRFGYEIWFSKSPLRFFDLRACELPPPVDDVPARLDEKAALADLKRIWDEQIAGPKIREHFGTAAPSIARRAAP